MLKRDLGTGVRRWSATASGALVLWLLGGPDAALSAQVSLGIKGGLSGSTMQANENVEGWRVGVTASAFIEVSVAPWLAFRPELGYTQRGARVGDFTYVGDPPTISSYSDRWASDYVELAGLVHLKPGSEAAEWRFGLLVGPVLSHMVKNERFRSGGTPTEPPDLRETNLGIAAGISAVASRYLVEVRYEGFNDQLESYGWMIHHYVAVLFGLRVL